MTRGEQLLPGLGGRVDRGPAGSQQNRQRLALSTRAGRAEPGTRQRLTGGADRVERVGGGAVASCGPLRPVQLHHQFLTVGQVPGQTSTVTAGALDRPRPQREVLVGELGQPLVAVCGGLDSDLTEHRASACLDRSRRVGVHVGVDPDDDIDDIPQTGHAFSPCLDGTWFRSGAEIRQDCDQTRRAPQTLDGQAPDQASYSDRAGAGDHERTSPATRHQASQMKGHTRGRQPTAHHHQAAKAILTVR
jgi:hypothetical protein